MTFPFQPSVVISNDLSERVIWAVEVHGTEQSKEGQRTLASSTATDKSLPASTGPGIRFTRSATGCSSRPTTM